MSCSTPEAIAWEAAFKLPPTLKPEMRKSPSDLGGTRTRVSVPLQRLIEAQGSALSSPLTHWILSNLPGAREGVVGASWLTSTMGSLARACSSCCQSKCEGPMVMEDEDGGQHKSTQVGRWNVTLVCMSKELFLKACSCQTSSIIN